MVWVWVWVKMRFRGSFRFDKYLNKLAGQPLKKGVVGIEILPIAPVTFSLA
jgi:hypothetical protein